MSLFKPRRRNNGLLAVCRGTGGIALAAVRREGDRPPSLVACEFHADGRAAALAGLARRGEFAGLPCTSTIDAADYNLLLVEAPEVPPAELRAAMRWRIKDLIDFPVDDAVIDVLPVPSRKGSRQNMMYVIAARPQVVRQQVDELVDAGFDLTAIDVPELAYRNLATMLAEDAGGVAFISFAPDHGLITLTRQRTLYLARRFEPGFAALQAGIGLPDRLDAVSVEIQRSLDYYDSHFGQPPVAGIVIAPPPHACDGLVPHLARQLGIPTRMLDINELIDCVHPLDVATQAHCLTAIGAALRGAEAA